MADSKMSRKKVRGREREEQALQLRIAGLTYKRIGEAMGISESGAYKAVIRALRRLNERVAENAGELRRIEMERLNALHLAFWPRARQGDEKAADRILRIDAAVRALNGLDAPFKTDITTDGQSLGRSFEEALQFVYGKNDGKDDAIGKDGAVERNDGGGGRGCQTDSQCSRQQCADRRPSRYGQEHADNCCKNDQYDNARLA